MASDPRPGVLFDIDGTLVDTNYLHTLAWFRALDRVGEHVPMAAIHRRIGMGSDKLLPDLIGREDDEADDLHGRFYEELHDDVRAFPAAGEILREVQRRGGRVVLATSAKERDLKVLLGAIAANDAVDHVTSSGDVESSKPSPDIFAVALEAAGLERERTMVVGDTGWDVEAAGRCGLPCIAVLTGGWSTAELESAGAVAVYDDVASLLTDIGNSP